MMQRLLALAAAWSLMCSLAWGQAPGAVPRLSSEQRAAALRAIESAFQEQYVFPEMLPSIIERLREGQRDGRYALDDPRAFADKITEDLREVGRDKHLSLSVDPAGYAAAIAPAESDAGQQASWRRLAIRGHHGLTETKVLGGNVRYLKISGFEWVDDVTGAAYDDAMRFLKEGDAAIIDIRGNGGGSHGAVRYLVSHFLDANLLEVTFLEGTKPPVQSRALDHLPAGRLQGMPLYVLIDAGVASAAEAFAYDVQQFKLGELVGTKTVGAGNNNRLLPIAPNFILSISYGRPVHAVSNTNWEGIGVAPTVETSSARALDVAHALALTRLEKNPGATVENRADYAWAKVAADARLRPVTVAPARLKGLAARYGSAEIDFRDGALWLKRPNRETARLLPMTADGLFAVDNVDYLRVRLNGRTLEMLRADDPQPRIFPRS